jgi:hypothetical protein
MTEIAQHPHSVDWVFSLSPSRKERKGCASDSRTTRIPFLTKTRKALAVMQGLIFRQKPEKFFVVMQGLR